MISNTTIKEEIKDAINYMQQWIDMKLPSDMYRSAIILETLVELLEVDNCGSVGGFDDGQEVRGNRNSTKNLIKRAEWVLGKGPGNE